MLFALLNDVVTHSLIFVRDMGTYIQYIKHSDIHGAFHCLSRGLLSLYTSVILNSWNKLYAQQFYNNHQSFQQKAKYIKEPISRISIWDYNSNNYTVYEQLRLWSDLWQNEQSEVRNYESTVSAYSSKRRVYFTRFGCEHSGTFHDFKGVKI